MKIISILDKIEYRDGRPSVELLLENNSVKEFRIVFDQGQQMKKHESQFPIVVHIIKGIIDFGFVNERHILKQGALVALEANIPHDLIAIERSIVRLSIHNGSKDQAKSGIGV